jgi:hypothetical protein
MADIDGHKRESRMNPQLALLIPPNTNATSNAYRCAARHLRPTGAPRLDPRVDEAGVGWPPGAGLFPSRAPAAEASEGSTPGPTGNSPA